MAATSLETLPPTGAERQVALTEAVSKMRVRNARSTDQWLLIGGGVLLPLGALLILLGWWGASHTPRLFEQIPYMISGGILGLGLVVAGGFLYFAYWLTTLVRDQRAQTERVIESLSRIEQLLASGAVIDGGATPAGAARAPAVAAPPPGVIDGTFVATPKGSQFHRPDCPVVSGRAGLRRVSAEDKGMSACRICEPLG
jgi:hypothetical protein